MYWYKLTSQIFSCRPLVLFIAADSSKVKGITMLILVQMLLLSLSSAVVAVWSTGAQNDRCLTPPLSPQFPSDFRWNGIPPLAVCFFLFLFLRELWRDSWSYRRWHLVFVANLLQLTDTCYEPFLYNKIRIIRQLLMTSGITIWVIVSRQLLNVFRCLLQMGFSSQQICRQGSRHTNLSRDIYNKRDEVAAAASFVKVAFVT